MHAKRELCNYIYIYIYINIFAIEWVWVNKLISWFMSLVHVLSVAAAAYKCFCFALRLTLILCCGNDIM